MPPPSADATSDRLVSMRDGMFVDDTSLAGAHPRGLGGLIGLEG